MTTHNRDGLQLNLEHDRYHVRMKRVTDFIDANTAAELSLRRLASVACLSPFHFHRIFKAMNGESLRSYVERRRLENALALARSGKSWKEAGMRSGYASQLAFGRAFKRVFGLPPTDFDLTDWWSKRAAFELGHKVSNYFDRLPPPIDPRFPVELIERPEVSRAIAIPTGC
jgi:AraC family transcriptional regulator